MALLGLSTAIALPTPASAATGPKVAIIVGPAQWHTGGNRSWANAAAREARRYTSNVVKVYSPNATWGRVKAAITNASVVVYLGVGFGSPVPFRRALNKSVQDGFALNPVAGRNNTSIRYVGESLIRKVHLAPNALVIIGKAFYAAGSSARGVRAPTLTIARKRVDDYGAGFLAAGASAVIVDTLSPPTAYIRALFTRNTTLDTIWRQAPSHHGHWSSFVSARTRGAIGRTDPNHAGSGFYRSIVGWPSTSTSAVRQGLPRAPTPAPAPPPKPAPAPAPAPAPPPSNSGKTVRVTSIASLMANLANNTIDTIVVANGTYHISPANATASDSLWVGAKFAGRTRPILVKAETRGGVTFDGGGGTNYSALSFEDGAHDQTWDGFVFANMRAQQSGIVEIGGYVPRRAPFNITLRFFTLKSSCRGQATSPSGPATEHGFYISNAKGVGPNHLLLEDITVDGTGGLASAVQFDHGDAANPNASNVTVRRLHVTGTQQAILLWTPTVRNITFDTAVISNASEHAVRFESVGASGVVVTNFVSSGSGMEPFYSSMGSHPPGLTMSNDTLH